MITRLVAIAISPGPPGCIHYCCSLVFALYDDTRKISIVFVFCFVLLLFFFLLFQNGLRQPQHGGT